MKLSSMINRNQEQPFSTWKKISSDSHIGNSCQEDYGTEEKELTGNENIW